MAAVVARQCSGHHYGIIACQKFTVAALTMVFKIIFFNNICNF
jgi:hypothetical protein